MPPYEPSIEPSHEGTLRCRLKDLRFLPRVERGYRRAYRQCSLCQRVGFYDYVPFSLSNPILIMPCGHLYGEYAKGISEAAALPLILEQRGAR